MEKTKQPLPPYLSLPKVKALFELVSTRSLNGVTLDELRTYGFGGTDANVAIATLRFLGLVDSEGKSTDQWRKLQLTGDVKKVELRGIIKVAYHAIFERVEEPYKLTRDELLNEFLIVYRTTPRIARAAAPVFLWLCGRADLVEEINVRKVRKNSKHSPSPKERGSSILKSEKRTEKGYPPPSQVYSFEHEGIEVSVPIPRFTKAINHGELLKIEEAISEFVKGAKKYDHDRETLEEKSIPNQDNMLPR
ncbi:MAG: DUF5343 domain-containing protein [Candidatus Wildermuthbacteria bacterium]|nr:DUF5343 domain-containing protein [Candidatus Wildermuthbacteria bacterium]